MNVQVHSHHEPATYDVDVVSRATPCLGSVYLSPVITRPSEATSRVPKYIQSSVEAFRLETVRRFFNNFMDVLFAVFPIFEVNKTRPGVGASALCHDFKASHRGHRVDPFNLLGHFFQLAHYFVCVFQRRPGRRLHNSVDGALVFIWYETGRNLLADIKNA